MLAGALAGVAACGSGEPRIVGVHLLEGSGREVPVDRSVGVVVEVHNPGGAQLEFVWTKTRGSFLPDRTNGATTIYTAPAQPGPDPVTVEIWREGEKLDAKTVQLTIVERDAGPPHVPQQTPPPPPRSVDPGAAGAPKIGTLEPRPESCDSSAGCVITVSGTWQRSGPPNTKLVVVVRPLPRQADQSWWVQSEPALKGASWSASPVQVGQPGDPNGTPFSVCVVATSVSHQPGAQLAQPPAGPRHCVDVTRGR